MKKKQFYQIILKDIKDAGVLYAPKGTDLNFGLSVAPVYNGENTEFILRDGKYLPFMNSNTVANFANEELKELIQEVIPPGYPLDFYPIKVKSEEYGDRIYHLIHFKIIFDVIDSKNSVWVAKSITKPWIIYEKAKDLDFFNSSARTNGIIVSDKFRKLMRKHKLDIGIEFMKVPYVE